MDERKWQLSIEAESNEYLQELHGLTSSIVEHQETVAGDIVALASGSMSDTQSRDAHLRQFLTSDEVQTMSATDVVAMQRALAIPVKSEWGYGNTRWPGGLYGDVEDVSVRHPGTDDDRYVLSGLVGHDLLGRSKKLDRLVHSMECSSLERLVLLGGIALAGSDGEYLTGEAVSYRGEMKNGLVPITKVGATFHGDFRVARGERFFSDVTDPHGHKWPFGPIIPEALVGAYHSTEPEILGAILLHQSQRGDTAQLKDMYQSISARLERAEIKGNGRGLFADYGQDDGRREAEGLKYRLKNKSLHPEFLGEFIVNAGDFNLRLTLTSHPDGIMFSHDETVDNYKSFLLPNNEVEDFILALFSNNYGRTSPSALWRVLEVVGQ